MSSSIPKRGLHFGFKPKEIWLIVFTPIPASEITSLANISRALPKLVITFLEPRLIRSQLLIPP